jgi:hypothetical protein
MTHLIPETPNRQPIFLTVEAESVRNAIVAVQEAGPSTESIELCRTPPFTVAANVVVISIGVAEPARKRRK